jgi:vacuolar-type H+-ATPase subunit H
MQTSELNHSYHSLLINRGVKVLEENIISDIIEIDEQAKDKLAAADKKRIQIIASAKTERDEMIADKLKKTHEKLDAIEKSEIDKADTKNAQIQDNMKSEIERIDSIFAEKGSQWVDEIVKAIVNS